MPDLTGSQTNQNLADAFARESQAGVRYLWFAQQADIEGRPDIAALFRSIADTEIGHAHGVMEFVVDDSDPVSGLPVGDTEDNLRAAIAGETDDSTHRYPTFAETARAEGFDEIAGWFDSLARSEQGQADRFVAGLRDLA